MNRELAKLKPSVTPIGGDRLSVTATEFVPKQSDWYKLSISKEELIQLQKLDLSLEPCFKQVGRGKLGKKIEFVLKEGILCRMSSTVQAQID